MQVSSPLLVRSGKNISPVFLAGIVALALGGIGGSFQVSRLLIILFAVGLLARSSKIASPSPPAVGNTCLIFCAISVCGTVSLTFSPEPQYGLAYLAVTVLSMGSLAFVACTKPTIQDAKLIQSAWVVAVVATFPFAAYELLTDQHFVYALEERSVGGEFGVLKFAAVFFGNYNNYSVFLCLAYPIVLAWTDGAQDKTTKALGYSVIACVIALIVINSSRISVAFLSLVTMIWFVRSVKGSLVTMALLGTLLYLLGDELEQFLDFNLYRFNEINAIDESTAMRLDIIKAGLDVLSDTYGLGPGLGSFEWFLSTEHHGLIPNAHNLLLEIAVNFTVLGLALFLMWQAYLWTKAVRRKDLPFSIRFPLIYTIPAIPLLGAVNSTAWTYIYWWYWFITAVHVVSIERSPK